MKILGISAFYHDASAAVLQDGEIIAAAQQERFSRIKNDPAFPREAVQWCLGYAGLGLRDIDAVAFYDKPFLKFERLLETYYAYAPSGLRSFLRSMPVWIKEKLFLKRLLYEELGKIERLGKKRPLLLFPEHHLSHAASAYYPSPYPEAAILTLDGVGEWATVSISHGTGKDIRILRQLDFPHSLGLLYSAVTYYCGFAVNSGEYKLMGLAPYGNRESGDCQRIAEVIRTKLVDIKEDGSIFLRQEYFDYAVGSRMVKDRVWKELFGFPRREPDGPLDPVYCDMALAIQEVTEEIVLRLAREAKRLTGSDRLCMAGGVTLNCVANGRLQEESIFRDIFIQPAAGDAGGGLGAAYAAHHLYFGGDKLNQVDALKGSYLGPEFSATDILPVARKYGLPFRRMESVDALATETARLIAEGGVIGWFQGRMEFGPRALGARSILADARLAGMQKKLNLGIKNREGFRPFAPAVLAEEAANYFELEGTSPYMLFVKKIRSTRRIPLPEAYAKMGWMEKLYVQRSDLPAVTHVDYSARIQTVDERAEPRFRRLLEAFYRLTGCPVVINTSFNVRDEPMVNTPEDAFRCFQQTEMDHLVMGDFIFSKKAYLAKE
jgi:carbamoyltransferase